MNQTSCSFIQRQNIFNKPQLKISSQHIIPKPDLFQPTFGSRSKSLYQVLLIGLGLSCLPIAANAQAPVIELSKVEQVINGKNLSNFTTDEIAAYERLVTEGGDIYKRKLYRNPKYKNSHINRYIKLVTQLLRNHLGQGTKAEQSQIQNKLFYTQSSFDKRFVNSLRTFEDPDGDEIITGQDLGCDGNLEELVNCVLENANNRTLTVQNITK